MKTIDQTSRQAILPLYPNRGITLVRGGGMYLYDETGKPYLDLMSNYGVNILGYNNKEINTKLIEQINHLINLHGSFHHPDRDRTARKLLSLCPKKLKHVYFANSGAEAIEAALKFARLVSNKTTFISMNHGYHGKTLGALSATNNPKYQTPFLPLLWNFVSVDFGSISQLEQQINFDTAAVILEPIQGEAGICFPPTGYLAQVKKLCQDRGVLLIIDEIQTGGGRTGTFLAMENAQIQPDILCLGKGLAGGLPVGVTLVTDEIAQKLPRGVHTSTFGGNPLTCSGIVATLDYLNSHQLLAHVRKIGRYFLEKLKLIKSPLVKEVRGLGLMLGIELTQPNTPVLKSLQEKGILAIPAGNTVVRFLPPFIIQKNHIDVAIEILQKILK